MSPTTATQTNPRTNLRAGLPDRYLTPDDIAEMFEVSKETVYAWRKKRIGPPGFRVGKHVRYDPAAVKRWQDARMAAEEAA
ncbi:helix-turn-helix domain-containing protein [Streptomyces javensis]|uniref:helix-turn-helix transcriptional regulator n=1 Tax=Streptomyces javensis TaxID=114698 RepID=UPI0033F5A613